MDVGLILLIALISAALLFLTATILSAPLRITLRAALNAALGLAALLLVNTTGSVTGLALSITPLSALAALILGVPGLGLLFLAQWMLT